MPTFHGQLAPEEVWDVVHYVQSLRVHAHASELVAAGLKPEDWEEALTRLWVSLSEAASKEKLDQMLLQKELAELRLNGGQTKEAMQLEKRPGGIR